MIETFAINAPGDRADSDFLDNQNYNIAPFQQRRKVPKGFGFVLLGFIDQRPFGVLSQ
jgi:hypothetical protein